MRFKGVYEKGVGFNFPQLSDEKQCEIFYERTKGNFKTLITGMFENGKICALEMVENVLTIVPATASHKTVFIHYTEPLNTVYNSDKYFAVDPTQECPRLVQLIAGDEWMSTDATIALEGRIAKVTDTKGWYSVTKMANGDNGHHYVFLG